MDIKSIGPTNFCAGKVILKNVKSAGLKTYNDIKALAFRTDYDIHVSKAEKPLSTMKKYDLYHVMAVKQMLKNEKKAVSFPLLAKKGTPLEEISGSIYEYAVDAVNKLISKIYAEKPPKPQFAKKRPNPFFR